MIIDEMFGALGWLDGTIALSDRAREYKAEKLKKLLLEAELHLKTLKDKT